MSKNLLRFLLFFSTCITIVYVLHLLALGYFQWNSKGEIVNTSYLFNSMYTIVLTSSIIILSERLKDQLGFIFLAGSFLKIGCFLAVIKLYDIQIDKTVFLDFFVPYFVCLLIEVYFISKLLNAIK